MAGIYIHIPFCRQACHYCDFHFSTNLSYKTQMVLALVQELNLQRQYLQNNKIETIYFGGGTPSLLDGFELSQILNKIQQNFNVSPDAEITIEANPDDLSFEKSAELKALGFNRLSVGVQSYSDETLKYLNRIHSANEAYQCVTNARRAGFDNINIDLIYGIPIGSHSLWEADLQTAGSIMPDHISAYCLTIESGTAFGSWMKKGKLTPADEEYAAKQFEFLLDFLQKHSYEQYEISNFCLPGKYSRHNTNYWWQEKYLGIGPGAHSFDGMSRQFNVSNNIKYLRSIESGVVPLFMEQLTIFDKINEYLMTSLRTVWGCSLNKILLDFGYDLYQNKKAYIDGLVEMGLGIFSNNIICLTTKGKLLADKIASDLFVAKNGD